MKLSLRWGPFFDEYSRKLTITTTKPPRFHGPEIAESFLIMGKESKTIGDQGEERARTYLEQKGYLILERNYHSQQGEIDIIAKEKEMLVFVEVKYYSFRSLSSPLYSVRKSKRESIVHAARTYLLNKKITGVNCRFDVLAFYRARDGQVVADHIKDAFYVS